MTAYGNGTFTLLGAGGTQTVSLLPGTTAATFNLAGLLTTYDISSAAGATVTVNNTLDVANNLTLNTNGGNLVLASTAGALGTTAINIDGGSFSIGSSLLNVSVLSGASVSFGASHGTAVVGASSSLVSLSLLDVFAPITGYTSTSDVIDDQTLAFSSSETYTISGSASDQTITITTTGGRTLSFATDGSNFVDGSYSATTGPLHLTADGSGGTAIAACFLRGTRIAAPEGEIPVEDLKIGDLVLTNDGRMLPVRWIGRNTIITRFADPLRAMPIRIEANSLSDGVPKRDLLLSPDHALLVDGLLIQAGALVNGMSITREVWMPESFTYYHVEVEDHSLILAEDTPAETFVDNVARTVFDNWKEHLDLYGFDSYVPEMSYPRVLSARQLPDEIEKRLLARSTGELKQVSLHNGHSVAVDNAQQEQWEMFQS
jgi:hypothetical protein